MIEILDERRYGEPKLKKPKALNGVKQCMSYDYNRHCKMPVYVVENDIYIKHRDWCSITLYKGKKYEEWRAKHSKFIYNDCFGAVVLRGEAWMILHDALANEDIISVLRQISMETIGTNSRFNSDDERMFADVTEKLWREKYHH